MYTSIVDIFISACTIGIVFLSAIKVIWFMKERTENDHPMCLLYFPGIDIQYTSDSRSKYKKIRQNNLTYSITVLATILLLVVKFLYK